MSKDVIENCLKDLISSGDKKTIDNVIALLLAVKDFNRSPTKSPAPKPKMLEKSSQQPSKKIDENVSCETLKDADYASLLLDGIDEEKARTRVIVHPSIRTNSIHETMSSETMSYLDQLL